MKFSVLTAALFTIFAVSRAIPVTGSFDTIDDVVERYGIA
jgi:hypothetical protein